MKIIIPLWLNIKQNDCLIFITHKNIYVLSKINYFKLSLNNKYLTDKLNQILIIL